MGEINIIHNKSFEEYLGLPNDVFDKYAVSQAKSLWNLLFQIEPFIEQEKEEANKCLIELGIYELIEYSYNCNHMTKTIFDELMEYLNFIFSDYQNGFLLDMIIDYFIED